MAIRNGSFETPGDTAGSASYWVRSSHNERVSVCPFTGDDRPVERFSPSLWYWELTDVTAAGINPESFEDSAWVSELLDFTTAEFETLEFEDFEGDTCPWYRWVPSFVNELLIPFDDDVLFSAGDLFTISDGAFPASAPDRPIEYDHHVAGEEVSGVSLTSAARAVTAAEFVTWFLGTFEHEFNSPFDGGVAVVEIDGKTYVRITAAATGTPPVDYLYLFDGGGWDRLIPTRACSWLRTGTASDLTAAAFTDGAMESFENEPAASPAWTDALFSDGAVDGTVESFEGTWPAY